MSLQVKKCRLCRKENKKLFLKGERCQSVKCSFTRRSYAPGAQGKKFAGKLSDYGSQLREKQICKEIFKIRENTLRKYYEIAAKAKGGTGEKLIQLLETRLDNIVYKLGFTSSRSQAQQLVNHGHILINNKKLDIPSYQVKLKDKISVAENYKTNINNKSKQNDIPLWLQLNSNKTSGTLLNYPTKEDLMVDFNVSQIVEFYSR